MGAHKRYDGRRRTPKLFTESPWLVEKGKRGAADITSRAEALNIYVRAVRVCAVTRKGLSEPIKRVVLPIWVVPRNVHFVP